MVFTRSESALSVQEERVQGPGRAPDQAGAARRGGEVYPGSSKGQRGLNEPCGPRVFRR